MKQSYKDILDLALRVGEAPQWFDRNGTPRFCKFSPNLFVDRNIGMVALVKVSCQECGTLFVVEYPVQRIRVETEIKRILIPGETLFDPPSDNHALDCTSGFSMTSIVREVLEIYVWENYQWTNMEKLLPKKKF